MKLTKIIISEITIVIASVLVFRSLWIILDKHFGNNNLELMLTIGTITLILCSALLHHEINCELKNLKQQTNNKS